MFENLRMVELYCVNQGDKFHGLSNDVLVVLASDVVEDMKAAQVRVLCGQAAPKFSYHVNRILENLDFDIDAD
jgi:hypothetical protein